MKWGEERLGGRFRSAGPVCNCTHRRERLLLRAPANETDKCAPKALGAWESEPSGLGAATSLPALPSPTPLSPAKLVRLLEGPAAASAGGGDGATRAVPSLRRKHAEGIEKRK